MLEIFCNSECYHDIFIDNRDNIIIDGIRTSDIESYKHLDTTMYRIKLDHLKINQIKTDLDEYDCLLGIHNVLIEDNNALLPFILYYFKKKSYGSKDVLTELSDFNQSMCNEIKKTDFRYKNIDVIHFKNLINPNNPNYIIKSYDNIKEAMYRTIIDTAIKSFTSSENKVLFNFYINKSTTDIFGILKFAKKFIHNMIYEFGLYKGDFIKYIYDCSNHYCTKSELDCEFDHDNGILNISKYGDAIYKHFKEFISQFFFKNDFIDNSKDFTDFNWSSTNESNRIIDFCKKMSNKKYMILYILILNTYAATKLQDKQLTLFNDDITDKD